MNPIRRRPCADPGQKQVPGEWMTQKGIDSSKPVTEEASRAKMIKHTSVVTTGSDGFTPAFPAQWFYGLFRALPGERILVVTVTSGLKAQSNPVGLDVASASLAPATGVRTTRLCRPLKRRSSRAPSIAHEVHLALRPTIAPDASASTASRPAFVTTRDRPSVGQDGNGYRFDSSQAGIEIFLQMGLDRKSVICPTGKIRLICLNNSAFLLSCGPPRNDGWLPQPPTHLLRKALV